VDDAELRALLAAQARLITELSERIAPTRPTITVAELYKTCEISQQHRPGWVTSAHLLRPLIKRWGSRDVASLMVADWTAYRVERSDLAATSLNSVLACLLAMVRWGKREGMYPAVPQLCEAKRLKAKKHRESATTEEDVEHLLFESDLARDTFIILAANDAGLRNSEIRLLEHSWVDRARLQINLPAAITKSRRARSVPITRRLLASIDALPRDIRSPLVLRSPRTGGAYSRNWMSMIWRGLAERAELKPAAGEKRVPLHSGRRGYATRAVERGVRIEVLQQILGHANLQQTADYVASRPTDLSSARETFERGIERDRTRR
jgi:integrase/recombinase XerD